MRIRVLGPVRVWRGEEEVDLGGPAQRAVLGLLAVSAGRPVSRGELVESLWGDDPPPAAVNIIQTHVKRLRRVLEPGRERRTSSTVLPRSGDGYALPAPPWAVDVLDFRRLVSDAAAQREASRAAELLGAALQLWQGPPLADVPQLAEHPKVAALTAEHRAAVVQYANVMVAVGGAADALSLLEEAAGWHPLDEAVQACVVQVHQAAGRRGSAFALYHTTRGRLARELGVDPGPELAAAHAALLAGDGGSAAEAPAPAQLPADVPPFVGRHGELADLDGVLIAEQEDGADDPSAAVALAIVSGTAGVGKTALAIRWAHRARRHFPDGQLYVDLRGYDAAPPVQPGHALTGFLRALGVAGDAVPVDIDDRAALYRSTLHGRRLLIVLDNASSAEQVRPLLPGRSSCAVLVTSRDSLGGLVARHGARRLDLDLMPLDHAVDLLGQLVGPRVEAEPGATRELAEQCVRLPLALRVAAELVNVHTDVQLADLVRDLADQQRRLEFLDAGDPQAAVRRVFSWSYRGLTAGAARAFRLAGLHPGPNFDIFALAALAGTDLWPARRLADELVRAHLVQRCERGQYAMHGLLRAYAADLATELDPPTQRRTALANLYDHYLRAAAAAMDTLHPAERHWRPRVAAPRIPVPEVARPDGAQAWLEREWPNLQAAIASAAAGGWLGHAVSQTLMLPRFMDGSGRYVDSMAIHDCALWAARQAGDAVGEARLLIDAAQLCVNTGRHATADDKLREAIALTARVDDRAGAARAWQALGNALLWRGRYEEAAAAQRRALEGFTALGDRFGQAVALGSLGHTDLRRHDYESAGRYLADAAAILRAVGDRTRLARALGNLGYVRLRQRRFTDAAGHLESARRLFSEIGDRVSHARAVDALGEVYLRQDDPHLARAHRARALEVFREVGDASGEATALTGLGEAELRLGRYGPAGRHLRQALAGYRRTGERPGEARALNGLGELAAASRPQRARGCHAEALAIATDLGDRYEQARAHAGLAQVCLSAGERAGAGQHWREALTHYTAVGAAEEARLRDPRRSRPPEGKGQMLPSA